MTYTIITTNRSGQSAVVAASKLDVLHIVKAAEDNPHVSITIFNEDGCWVPIAELEGWREKVFRSHERQRRRSARPETEARSLPSDQPLGSRP